MSAESYGGLIWGSKALRGNLSPPGVAPRGVKNNPYSPIKGWWHHKQIATKGFMVDSSHEHVCEHK